MFRKWRHLLQSEWLLYFCTFHEDWQSREPGSCETAFPPTRSQNSPFFFFFFFILPLGLHMALGEAPGPSRTMSVQTGLFEKYRCETHAPRPRPPGRSPRRINETFLHLFNKAIRSTRRPTGYFITVRIC